MHVLMRYFSFYFNPKVIVLVGEWMPKEIWTMWRISQVPKTVLLYYTQQNQIHAVHKKKKQIDFVAVISPWKPVVQV